jgi:hypothetical protein
MRGWLLAGEGRCGLPGQVHKRLPADIDRDALMVPPVNAQGRCPE